MIVSITVSSNREKIIGDAIKSVVSWVDKVLVVYLNDNITPIDSTLDIAKEIAKDKLVVVEMSIDSTVTMADIRNFGIMAATDIGGTWSVQLDTDERILLNGINIKETLKRANPGVTSFLVQDDKSTYDKYRFQRLPTNGKYVDGVHEEWRDPDGIVNMLPSIRFHELEKPLEVLKNRLLNNDLPGLMKQIKNEPSNHRWHYYLGVTLESLERTEEAVESYKLAVSLSNTSELKAWIYFRISFCYHILKQYDTSLRFCMEGLIENPEYTELLWLAGINCLYLNKLDAAIYWEKLAIVGTWIGKKPNQIKRSGFKEIQAFFESPYAVLIELYKLKGELGLTQWAKREYDRAVKEREKYQAGKV